MSKQLSLRFDATQDPGDFLLLQNSVRRASSGCALSAYPNLKTILGVFFGIRWIVSFPLWRLQEIDTSKMHGASSQTRRWASQSMKSRAAFYRCVKLDIWTRVYAQRGSRTFTDLEYATSAGSQLVLRDSWYSVKHRGRSILQRRHCCFHNGIVPRQVLALLLTFYIAFFGFQNKLKHESPPARAANFAFKV